MPLEHPSLEPTPADSPLKLRNRLQLELAKRHCVECDNKALTDYIFDELSPAVSALLKREPQILDEYARDPEATVARVEEELHLALHSAEK